MLDSAAAMTRFMKLIGSEPDIARVPRDDRQLKVERDRGRAEVRAGQIHRQLDFDEGRRGVVYRAGKVARRYGAAVIVMAFDEQGQADTFERKIGICERSYRLLVDTVGFPPEDIVFDPNVFAIATGIEEHNNYAVDFIEATRWIKQNLPLAKVSGGVSNVSFSFRGNDHVREAIHTVFLYHAITRRHDDGYR